MRLVRTGDFIPVGAANKGFLCQETESRHSSSRAVEEKVEGSAHIKNGSG